ncbi:hypothetical protein MMC17_006276 [Xylographa soralifera]|nr:hypothetical protein [Xylographa soralifera]
MDHGVKPGVGGPLIQILVKDEDMGERKTGDSNSPNSDVFREREPSVLKEITRIQLLISFQYETPSFGDLESQFDFIMRNCTRHRLNLQCLVEHYKDEYAEGLCESFHHLSGFKSCSVGIPEYSPARRNTLLQNLADQARRIDDPTTSKSHGSSSGFPFMRLPKELRYQILRHTDLVVGNKASHSWADGFVISNRRDKKPCIQFRKPYCGQCNSEQWVNLSLCFRTTFFTSCACFLFPTALFTVSRQVSLEAHKVLFSENRFILHGDPALKLAFLQCHSLDMLQCIHKLDLYFSATDINSWAHGIDHSIRRRWEQLIEFIRRNLNLSNLTLSVDAGAVYDSILDPRLPRFDFENYITVWRTFAKPLLQLKGLAEFHVFLACAFGLETQFEREVMDERYASVTHGKVAYKMRDHDNPHWRPLPGEQRRGMWLLGPIGHHHDECDVEEYEDSDVEDGEDGEVAEELYDNEE